MNCLSQKTVRALSDQFREDPEFRKAVAETYLKAYGESMPELEEFYVDEETGYICDSTHEMTKEEIVDALNWCNQGERR